MITPTITSSIWRENWQITHASKTRVQQAPQFVRRTWESQTHTKTLKTTAAATATFCKQRHLHNTQAQNTEMVHGLEPTRPHIALRDFVPVLLFLAMVCKKKNNCGTSRATYGRACAPTSRIIPLVASPRLRGTRAFSHEWSFDIPSSSLPKRPT